MNVTYLSSFSYIFRPKASTPKNNSVPFLLRMSKSWAIFKYSIMASSRIMPLCSCHHVVMLDSHSSPIKLLLTIYRCGNKRSLVRKPAYEASNTDVSDGQIIYLIDTKFLYYGLKLDSLIQVISPLLSVYCRPKNHTSLKPMVFTTWSNSCLPVVVCWIANSSSASIVFFRTPSCCGSSENTTRRYRQQQHSQTSSGLHNRVRTV
ncbi:hypothetical protein AGLY_005838 [Aphis glycines]|uniref:Uncharacterized protein n=1 Tax=Aphis glycines TaxID=307491 RepID=A0A6G0TUC5_APHGL|nr:hypothetical protein AGLY_005838 [Aphis glycines]